MYIIQSISKITGYICQGTHAFPTKKLLKKCLSIIGKHGDMNYFILNAPIGTPLINIKPSINNRFVQAYLDNSDWRN